nr:hypothetical protein [Nocardia sp. SYP-A9097]
MRILDFDYPSGFDYPSAEAALDNLVNAYSTLGQRDEAKTSPRSRSEPPHPRVNRTRGSPVCGSKFASLAFAVGHLITPFRDHCPDPFAPQQGSIRCRAIGSIGDHHLRITSWRAALEAGHHDRVEQRRQ